MSTNKSTNTGFTDIEALERFKQSYPEVNTIYKIVQLNEATFMRRYGNAFNGNHRLVRRVYQKALQIHEKQAIAWGIIKETVANSLVKDTLFNNIPDDFIRSMESIPGYNELFERISISDCDHCKSIFGPAAYFVDLMRFIENNITTNPLNDFERYADLTFDKRRPDLNSLDLDCDNTFNLVPFIKLVEEVLEALVRTQEEHNAWKVLAEADYPFNLPFLKPLDEIRAYLTQLKTSLYDIYHVFGITPPHLTREFHHLSPTEWELVSKPAIEPDELSRRFGIDVKKSGPGSLEDVETFLIKTGLTRQQLKTLLFQDLSTNEVTAGLSRLFYVNNVFDGLGFLNLEIVQTDTGNWERIAGLSFGKLDRIYRFLKMIEKLGWEYGELDWALRSLEKPFVPEKVLKFDGVNDFIQSKNVVHLDATSFTIEAWVNPEQKQVNPIICKGDQSNEKTHFSLWVDYTGKLRFYADPSPQDGEEKIDVAGVHTLPFGAFSHVAVSVQRISEEETQIILYLNGKEDKVAKSTLAIYPAGYDLFIGKNLADDAYQGLIKEVRIWQGVRNTEAINRFRYTKFTGMETGLIGYWPLIDEQWDKVIDHSINRNDGLPGGDESVTTPMWVQRDLVIDPVPQQVATEYMQFDSIDDYLENHSLEGLESFEITLEAWVNISAYRTNPILNKEEYVPAGETPVAGNPFDYYWNIDSSGKVRFKFTATDGEITDTFISGSKVPLAEWTHIAVTVSKSEITFFINGQVDSSGTQTIDDFPVARLADLDSVRVGRNNGSHYFLGGLKEVRIWTQRKVQYEVDAWMSRKLHGQETALAAYWPLDSIDNHQAADLSPFKNDLYLGGYPVPYEPVIQAAPPLYPSLVEQAVSTTEVTRGAHIILQPDNALGLGQYETFRLEFWFRPLQRTESHPQQVIFVQGDGENGLIVLLENDQLILHNWCADYERVVTREVSIQFSGVTTGSWHRFVISYDESASLSDRELSATLTIYDESNGATLMGTTTQTVQASPMSPVGKYVFGNLPDGQYARIPGSFILGGQQVVFFEGQIGEFRMWNLKLADPKTESPAQSVLEGTPHGLVGHFPLINGNTNEFRDTTDSWTAFFGKGNNGYLPKRPNIQDYPLLLMPIFTTALSFDGRLQNMAGHTRDEIDTKSFSIECWINVKVGEQQAIFQSINEQEVLTVGVRDTGHPYIEYSDGGAPIVTNFNAAVTTNTWHYVGFSTDGSQILAILDDTMAAVSLNNHMKLTSGTWRVGLNQEGNKLEGSIREFRLWQAFRSAEAIGNVRYHRIDPTEGSLIAYYDFREVKYGHIMDQTNNGNDFRLGGLLTDRSPELLDSTFKFTELQPIAEQYVLDFDGIDDYIPVSHFLGGQNVRQVKKTVEAIFEVPDTFEGSFDPKHILFCEGNENFGVNLYFADGKLYAGEWSYFSAGNPYEGYNHENFLITDQIEPNRLHHVALVMSGKEDGWSTNGFRAYLDGQPFNVLASADCFRHSKMKSYMTVGRAGDSTRTHDGVVSNTDHYQGKLQELRVWQTARSQEVISRDMWVCADLPSKAYLKLQWVLHQPTGGEVIDITGNGFNGMLGGGEAEKAPKWLNTARDMGLFNSEAYRFDGVDQYITLDRLGELLPMERFTLQFWIMPVMLGGSQPIWHQTNGQLNIRFSDHRLEVTMGQNTPPITAFEFTFEDHLWTNIALSYDASHRQLRFYVNGELQGHTNFDSGPLFQPDSTRVGTDGTNHFRGFMKEVRLFSVALTPAELNTYLFRRMDGSEPFVAGYWPLLENLEGIIIDQGDLALNGTANHGTGSPAPDWINPDLLATSFGKGFWSTDRKALAFNGVNTMVELKNYPDINMEIHQQRTIEVWFMVDDVNVSSRKQVIYEEGGFRRGLNLYVFNGSLYFGGYNTPEEESGWSGTFIKTDQIGSGKWHHAAIVLDGREEFRPHAFRAYLDGKLVDVGPGSQLWPHEAFPGLGGMNLRSRFHDGIVASEGVSNTLGGQILDFRMWNECRSADQLLAGLYRQLTGEEEKLILWWQFDDIGEDKKIIDKAVNGDQHNEVISGLVEVVNLEKWVPYFIPQTSISEDSLDDLVNVRKLLKRYDTPLEKLTALWYTFKHTGTADNKTQYDSIFNSLNGTKWPYYFDRAISWDLTGQNNPDSDREVRQRLMAAFGISSRDLDRMVHHLFGEDTTVVDVQTTFLQQGYQLARTARLLGVKVQELFDIMSELGLEKLNEISNFVRLSDFVSWMNAIDLDIAQLQYIIHDKTTKKQRLPFTENDIRSFSDALKQQAPEFLATSQMFFSEAINEGDSSQIYELLKSNGFIDANEAVTDTYQEPADLAPIATALNWKDAFDSADFSALQNNPFKLINNKGILLEKEDQYGDSALPDYSQIDYKTLPSVTGASGTAAKAAAITAAMTSLENQAKIQSAITEILVRRRTAQHQAVLNGTASLIEAKVEIASLLKRFVFNREGLNDSSFTKKMIELRNDQDISTIQDIVDAFTKMAKLQFIIDHFNMDIQEAKVYVNHPERYEVKSVFNPDVDDLTALQRYESLTKAFGDDDHQLLAILKLKSDSTQLTGDISQLTGWQEFEIEQLRERYKKDRQFQYNRTSGIDQLKAGFDLAELMQTRIDFIINMADVSNLDFDYYENVSEALLNVLRAKYEDNWEKVYKPIYDPLAVKQRDALTAQTMQQIPESFEGRRSPDLLYEWLLIDVQMGPETDTSYVVQAIAACQLYIQRCLMNLEIAVRPDSIPAEEWKWMKNYRVWEANRKVFLYPENYIEPELRDNKTPLFKDLEDDLVQGNITKDTVAKAYTQYLDKFTELANLQIVGSYMHKEVPPVQVVNALSFENRFISTDPSEDGRGYLVFDRDNDIQNYLAQDMTLELWVKPENFPFWGGIISAFQDNGSYEHGWVLGTYQGRFSFGLAATRNEPFENAFISYLSINEYLPANKWYHLAATYDGANMTIFVNGEAKVTTAVQSGPISYPDIPFIRAIGGYIDDNERHAFVGDMREVRIWNSAKTAAEIEANMYGSIEDPESHLDLVHYWPMDEGGSSLIVTDKGINTENLTISATTNNFKWITTPEIGPPSSKEDIPVTEKLYLVGRTETDPRTFYYREVVDNITWSPWEKIDLKIKSDYVTPVFAFNKLFLFWPELVEGNKGVDRKFYSPSDFTQDNQRAVKVNHDENAQKIEPTAAAAAAARENNKYEVYVADQHNVIVNDSVNIYTPEIKYSYYNFDKSWVQPQTYTKLPNISESQHNELKWHRIYAQQLLQLDPTANPDTSVKTLRLEHNTILTKQTTDTEDLTTFTISFHGMYKMTDALIPGNHQPEDAILFDYNNRLNFIGLKTIDISIDGVKISTGIGMDEHWKQLAFIFEFTPAVAGTEDAETGEVTGAVPAFYTVTWLINGQEPPNAPPGTNTAKIDNVAVLKKGNDLSLGSTDNSAIQTEFTANLGEFRFWDVVRSSAEIVDVRDIRLNDSVRGMYVYLALDGKDTFDSSDGSSYGFEGLVLKELESTTGLSDEEEKERILIFYGNTIRSLRSNLKENSLKLELLPPTEGQLNFDLRLWQSSLYLVPKSNLSIQDYSAQSDDSLPSLNELLDDNIPLHIPLYTFHFLLNLPALYFQSLNAYYTRQNNVQLFNSLPYRQTTLTDVSNQPGWYILNTGEDEFLIQAENPDIKTITERLSFEYDNTEESGIFTGSAQVVTIRLEEDPALEYDPNNPPRFKVSRLNSNAVQKLSSRLFAGGIDRLLNLRSQLSTEFDFNNYGYDPNYIDAPDSNPSTDVIDSTIDFNGSLGTYFWEIFFHIPFLIANQLNTNQKFEDAQRWYHYIFDPTIQDESKVNLDKNRFWRFVPFRNDYQPTLGAMLTNEAALRAYREDPFDPHAIARIRIVAYQKAVVMKYIDNLLDWGDFLFRQDTRESINEATQLYVLAFNLLGPRPTPKAGHASTAIGTFESIQSENNDKIPEFLTEAVKEYESHAHHDPIPYNPLTSLDFTFCVIENQLFLGYWDRVEDRLYKIRHSLNIDGVFRSLALFQPPIDPAALVRAVAGGRDIGSVTADLNVDVPHFRFSYMWERANNMVKDVVQLGSSLLAALEKKDAEELLILRNTHEKNIFQMMQVMKEASIAEGEATVESLKTSLANATYRESYYKGQLDGGLNASEITQLTLMAAEIVMLGIAGGINTASALAAAVPMLNVGVSGAFGSPVATTIYGGSNFSQALTAAAVALNAAAQATSVGAGIAGTVAGFQRRDEDWTLQQNVASYDKDMITQQITAAEARVSMLKQDLAISKKQEEQSDEIEDFLKTKFTNQELYQWMSNKISGLYFQCYKLAYDLCKSAEKAYQYELTHNDSFVNFGHWDSQRKGLLAGESLMLDMERMYKSYIDNHYRRLEVERPVSLAQHDPQALLEFISTGSCEFEFDERFFAQDYPGHYCRQIKTITISIPAVVGPYQTVKATLTQLNHRTLLEANEDAVKFLLGDSDTQPDASVLRSNWNSNQSVAISKGVDDSGLFMLDFRDERYLPFEYTGALSRWRLEMPKGTNAIDFASITDVIINISYYAKSDGGSFKNTVAGIVKNRTATRLFSLKHEFATSWFAFSHPEGSNPAKLQFNLPDPLYLPNFNPDRTEVSEIDFIYTTNDPDNTDRKGFKFYPEGEGGADHQVDLTDPGLPVKLEGISADITKQWVLEWNGTESGLEAVDNLLMVITYTGDTWE